MAPGRKGGAFHEAMAEPEGGITPGACRPPVIIKCVQNPKTIKEKPGVSLQRSVGIASCPRRFANDWVKVQRARPEVIQERFFFFKIPAR